MSILKKFLILISLFLYIFSIKITKIEPSKLPIGNNQGIEITLTYEGEYESETFYIGDQVNMYLIAFYSCSHSESTITCTCYTHLIDKENLDFPIKYLYVNDKPTDITVELVKPEAIKFISTVDSYGFTYYTYGNSRINLDFNLNTLFNSSIVVKHGDVQITNCEIDKTSINRVICYHQFTQTGTNIQLKINDEFATYYSIAAPAEFTEITNAQEIYYMSSTAQKLYFEVDSCYKIEDHSIVLVPSQSTNQNITLTSCTFGKDSIKDATCSGVLNANDIYDVYVDNTNTNLKIKVYQAPTSINKVNGIEPKYVFMSSESTSFTLKVDYVANLDKTEFSLISRFNSNNTFKLSNCKQVTDSTTEITCAGTPPAEGEYFLTVDGVYFRNIFIRVFSKTLSKAIGITPNQGIVGKAKTSWLIKIAFDSPNAVFTKKVELKGTSDATLKISEYHDRMSFEYHASFPAADTYYVYLDGVKQENAYITIYDNEIKIFSLTPNVVSAVQTHTFNAELSNNKGVSIVHFDLYNSKFILTNLKCEPSSSDEKTAFCTAYKLGEEEYNLHYSNATATNIKVSSKKMINIYNHFPISISSSSNAQDIVFNFNENIDSIVSKITFVNETSISPTCSKLSNYAIKCSAVFDYGGYFYVYIDGVKDENFVFVKGDKKGQDNTGGNNNSNGGNNNSNGGNNNSNGGNNNSNGGNNNGDNTGSQGGSEIDDDSESDNMNYIKMSSLILFLILLF